MEDEQYLLYISLIIALCIALYYNNTNRQRSIVLLAAGPPKPNRKSRWLEIFNDEILIDTNINACTFNNVDLYITINKNDIDLINHVKKYHSHVIILYSENEEWISTVNKFINIPGDIIIVCGDLVNIKDKYIKKFLDTPLTTAAQKLKYPWTNKNIISNSYRIMEGEKDISILLISDNHKYIWKDKEIIQKTKDFANDFNDNPSTKSGLFGGYMGYYFMEEVLKLNDNVGYIYLDEDEPIKDND
jgi:hypothetical protein